MIKHMATGGAVGRTMVRTFCGIEAASRYTTLLADDVTCRFCAARLERRNDAESEALVEFRRQVRDAQRDG